MAACGGGTSTPAPDAGPRGSFEIVGHADLGARGMNAALAVAGDTVYVGSRIDTAGIAIVDVSDPSAPAVVGAIGAPDEGVAGMSSRELRAVGDLLVVLNLQCSPDLHGCAADNAENENLKLYDISNRRAPALVGSYRFTSSIIHPRDPHEMYVWRDPDAPSRVLAYVTTPVSAPQFEVVDLSDPAAPHNLTSWDPVLQGGLIGAGGEDNLLHSMSASPDGRTGFFSHLRGGLYVADLSEVVDGAQDAGAPSVHMVSGQGEQADWSPPNPEGPHSAVLVPGRDVLVVTDEVYPPPFNVGCPWGWMRTVDVSDPTAPTVMGSFKVRENSMDCASATEKTTFTAHNATVEHDVALISWHSAGLQAVDISDPANPTSLAELRPEPLPSVTVEDPALGGNPVLMWSYPVIQDGLIYVVDIRNGLYILRYHGDLESEIADETFAEGNSNL